MDNKVQNLINHFFDNINWDLNSYSEVITYSSIEHFIFKGISLVVIFILARILLFYTVNNFTKLDRDIKGSWLSIKGKKIKLIPFKREKFTILHAAYLIVYFSIYAMAAITFIKGVIK